MKDIEIIDIDYSASDPKYKKEDIVEVAKIPSPFIVPEEGPFYDHTVRLINGGTDLVRGKDFTIIQPITEIATLTGKGVSLYIKLAQHVMTSGNTLNLVYQKVGNPIISRNKLLELLEGIVISGKPIDWETQVTGKPKTYAPGKHSMDVTKKEEVIGFGDMVQLFEILANREVGTGAVVKAALDKLQNEVYNQLDYIQKLRWGNIMGHSRNYDNPHGLVAKDVNCEKIVNNATATPQQDGEATRTDLYSTPAGLKRVLEESEPDSEEYIMQNEIPFSYYGSGIYLPPPIAGSFEGLGMDLENGAFCLEGNGWVVGLYRCFDGRVKNLYYTYDDSGVGDPYMSNWVPTYVQYQHPKITAAGLKPDTVMSGSGGDILMVGSGDTRWWLCDPNSTFDPSAHNLKEVDMSEVAAATTENGIGIVSERGTVFRMGDWVYLFVFHDGTWQPMHTPRANATGTMFRLRYADLINPALETVKFLKVNITYDDVNRTRYTNQTDYIIDRPTYDTEGRITKYIAQFSTPVLSAYSHRRRTIKAMSNPNIPNTGKIRMQGLIYVVHARPTGNNSFQLFWNLDYNFNGDTVTLELDPRMKPLKITTASEQWDTTGYTEENIARQIIWPSDRATGDIGQSTRPCVSRIPGFGFYSARSWSDGGLPLAIGKVKFNPTNDPDRDWETFDLPNTQYLPNGRIANFSDGLPMNSPFGVSAYPKWHTDLYEYNGKINATPIEVFLAIDELSVDRGFYRLCEEGSGMDYIPRANLNTPYIGPAVGRATNSKYGSTPSHASALPVVNNPRVKNEHSRQHGVFTHIKNKIGLPGAWESKGLTIGRDGLTRVGVVEDAQGYITLPLLLTSTVENGVLLSKATAARSVAIPREIWDTGPRQLLGADYANCLDIVTSLYIGSKDGDGVCPSIILVMYHTKAAPTVPRCVAGVFKWRKNGARPDGTPIMSWYNLTHPFTSASNNPPYELKPGITNNFVYQPSYDGSIAYNPDGTWKILNPGNVLTSPICQILEYPEEGNASYDIWFYPGWRLTTTGYSIAPCLRYAIRNGVQQFAKLEMPSTGAYVSYMTFQVANPQLGWLTGVNYNLVGSAMNMTKDSQGRNVVLGATFVEGNWSVIIPTPVSATFNGRTIIAKPRTFDLRDFATVYRNQVFYLYCVARGSMAEYELSKQLRHSTGDGTLVAIITTGDLGITQIERIQQFQISGFPLTRVRDAGVPVTSGSIWDRGDYQFLKRSELLAGNI